MDYNKYFMIENTRIPDEIKKVLKASGNISSTLFEEKDEILSNKKLQSEIGYKMLQNGDFQVSMNCPMKGVSKEMIDWWFWWHPKENIRYQLWYPGEHCKISFKKKDRLYFEQFEVPKFQNNTQYPVEKIGGLRLNLSIDFVTPESFGFSKEIINFNNIASIVCGHVGINKGLISHTEMAHIFFQNEDGLFLVSRFWIGKRLKNQILRKFILKESVAKGMAEHCYVEYRNLAKKLPDLYNEWLKDNANE